MSASLPPSPAGVASSSPAPTHSPTPVVSLLDAASSTTAAVDRRTSQPPPPHPPAPPPSQPSSSASSASKQRRRSAQRQSSVEARRGSVIGSVSPAPPHYESSSQPHQPLPPPSASARRQSLQRPRHSSAEQREEFGSNRSPSVVAQIPQKGGLGRSARPQRLHSSTTVPGSPLRLSATGAPLHGSRPLPHHRPSLAGLQGESPADDPTPPSPPTTPLQQTRGDSGVSDTPATPRSDAPLRAPTMADTGEEDISTEAAPPVGRTPSPDKVALEGEGKEEDSGGGGTLPSDAEPPPTAGNTTTMSPPDPPEAVPSTAAAPTAAASTNTHDARSHEHHQQQIHPHHHHRSTMFMTDSLYDHHHHHHTKYTEESENEGKDKGMRNRSQCQRDDESEGATSRGSSSEGVPGPCSAAGPSGRTVTRLLIVGWDKTRTRIMIALLAIFVVWLCIFFPLLGQM